MLLSNTLLFKVHFDRCFKRVITIYFINSDLNDCVRKIDHIDNLTGRIIMIIITGIAQSAHVHLHVPE